MTFPLRPRAPRLIALGCVCLLPALAGPASAEYEIVLGAGAEYTDNVFLDDEDPQDDTRTTTSLGVRYAKESPALDADIEGETRYFHYLDDTAGDETLTDLSAIATWRAVPDRLHFFAQDEASEIRGSPQEAAGPGTTQSANAFVVGPDLILGSGRVDRVTVSARYGEAYFEEGTDNERVGVGVRWLHSLSERMEAFVGAQRQEITFTEFDPIAVDFERDDVFIGLQRTLRRTVIDIELGAFEIRREDDALDPIDGGQGTFQWVQSTTPATDVTFRATRAVEDSGARLLSANESAISLTGADAIVTGDIVERDEFELGLDHLGPDYVLSTALVYTEEDFDQTDNDLESVGARAAVEYRLGPRSELGAGVTVSQQDFVVTDRVDDDLTARLGYRRGLSPKLALNLRYEYGERRSTEAGQDFEVNRVAAVLTYRFGSAIGD